MFSKKYTNKYKEKFRNFKVNRDHIDKKSKETRELGSLHLQIF